jgi:hypothetical protein
MAKRLISLGSLPRLELSDANYPSFDNPAPTSPRLL